MGSVHFGSVFQPQYAQCAVYVCYTTFHQHLFAGCEPNIRKARCIWLAIGPKDTHALGNRRSSRITFTFRPARDHPKAPSQSLVDSDQMRDNVE